MKYLKPISEGLDSMNEAWDTPLKKLKLKGDVIEMVVPMSDVELEEDDYSKREWKWISEAKKKFKDGFLLGEESIWGMGSWDDITTEIKKKFKDTSEITLDGDSRSSGYNMIAFQ